MADTSRRPSNITMYAGNLAEDIGQLRNRAQEHPDRVASMSERLAEIRQGEATRPRC